MMSETKSPILGTDFPAAGHADWLDAVEKALRGAAFETLISTDYGGVERQPLYTEADIKTQADNAGLPGFAPFTRGSRVLNDRYLPWQIAGRFTPGRKGSDNSDVLTDLEGGVSALLLDMPETADQDALAALLKGVKLDLAPILIRAGMKNFAVATSLTALAGDAGDAEMAALYIDFDPLGHCTANGLDPADTDIYSPLAGQADANHGAHIRLMTASGMAVHNAGADSATELACILASLVAYIEALQNAGFETAEALSRITLTVAADADFFGSIAKLRAARALWGQVCAALGVADKAPVIHAEGSERFYAVADPWVNILRGSIATLAAGIGGADIVTALPCTAVSDGDNILTRRIARNTQIILQEESHIGRVVDPAGGSWYVEALTGKLAEQAWALFQKIEQQGGLAAALSNGFLRDHISDIRAREQADTETRTLPLLGVSEFPNLGEAPLTPRPPKGQGALAEHRPASAFEALRLAAGKTKPKVYLAALGAPASYTGRVNFTANLFAAGGLDAVIGTGGDDIDKIIDDFKQSGLALAVICGSDTAYESAAAELANALAQAGAAHIWLAGKFTAPSVNGNIYMGCNALDILRIAHRQLGLQD